jgi:hypothetical protein
MVIDQLPHSLASDNPPRTTDSRMCACTVVQYNYDYHDQYIDIGNELL